MSYLKMQDNDPNKGKCYLWVAINNIILMNVNHFNLKKENMINLMSS